MAERTIEQDISDLFSVIDYRCSQFPDKNKLGLLSKDKERQLTTLFYLCFYFTSYKANRYSEERIEEIVIGALSRVIPNRDIYYYQAFLHFKDTYFDDLLRAFNEQDSCLMPAFYQKLISISFEFDIQHLLSCEGFA